MRGALRFGLALALAGAALLASAEDARITLGDANGAPRLQAIPIVRDLAYENASVREVNGYGLWLDVGVDTLPRGRALIVPFVGKPRELELERLFAGDPVLLILDPDGFVFVETELGFGCEYRVNALDPQDRRLWTRVYRFQGTCDGRARLEAVVERDTSGAGLRVDTYEFRDLREFKARVDPATFVSERLVDKRAGRWEIVATPFDPRGFGPEEAPEPLIVWAHNPRLGRRGSRIGELIRDERGRFYASYYVEGAEAYSWRLGFVVLFAPDGRALGVYEAQPGDEFSLWRPSWMGRSWGDAGELYFVRETVARERFDLLKIEPPP